MKGDDIARRLLVWVAGGPHVGKSLPALAHEAAELVAILAASVETAKLGRDEPRPHRE